MTMQSTEERLASTSNGYVYVAAGILLLLLAIGCWPCGRSGSWCPWWCSPSCS
jgi:hypothetical protein